jgi:hypothetical protein
MLHFLCHHHDHINARGLHHSWRSTGYFPTGRKQQVHCIYHCFFFRLPKILSNMLGSAWLLSVWAESMKCQHKPVTTKHKAIFIGISRAIWEGRFIFSGPSLYCFTKKWEKGRWLFRQWLIPIILVTWEAEIRRIMVWGQLRQIVWESPSPK